MRYQGIAIGAGLFAGRLVFALFLCLVASVPLPATAKVAVVNTYSAAFSVAGQELEGIYAMHELSSRIWTIPAAQPRLVLP